MQRYVALFLTYVYMISLFPANLYAAGPDVGRVLTPSFPAPVAAGETSGPTERADADQKPLVLLTKKALEETSSVSEVITPERGGRVKSGDAELIIPPGAVGEPTEIRITQLPQTAALEDDMANVTSGAAGYRFEPKGMKFNIPVEVRMGYDPQLEGNESALTDLYTYYYNVDKSKWEALERVGIDHEKRQLISQTIHFTDMINATLKLPEGPEPIQMNLNSIKSLEAANPGTGVAQLEGLEGDSNGYASFRLPLGAPGGRAGMQPQIALTYSSGGGSGLCGKGFDLSAGSSITTDTRWGLPVYPSYSTYATKGLDTYLLDGNKLVLKSQSGGTFTYTTERESAYEKIERIWSGSLNYWIVTEKNGQVKTYGNGTDTWSGIDSSAKFAWYLEKDVDVHGNYVRYYYEKDSGYVYVKTIAYTGSGSSDGPYAINFSYKKDRNDVRVDCRGKFVSELKWLLDKTTVSYEGDEIRTYCLGYTQNAYGQTELTDFSQQTGDAEFYRYKFGYVEPEKDSAGKYVFFEDQKKWALTKGLQVQQGVSSGTDFSASLGAGIGIPKIDIRATVGGNGGYSGGSTQSKQFFLDINGDSLPDSVRKVANGLEVSENNGHDGFNKGKLWSLSLDAFGVNSTKNVSVGWNVYGGAGTPPKTFSAGATYSETYQSGWANTDSGFSDVDGDGLIDVIISGKDWYYRNTGEDFKKTDLMSAGASVSDTVEALSDDEKESYHTAYYQEAPLRSWRAPMKGTVNIAQSVKSANTTMSDDGLTAKTYVGESTDPDTVLTIKGNTTEKTSTKEYAIERSDAFYFLEDAGLDTRSDDVNWNIKIAYSNVQLFGEMDRNIVYVPQSELSVDVYENDLNESLQDIYTKASRSVTTKDSNGTKSTIIEDYYPAFLTHIRYSLI